MKRHFAFTAALLIGCSENVAVGNDREAELDPPPQPADVVQAAAALQGVATGLVVPQIMTTADLGAIRDAPDRCIFRMTEVGEPVVVYDGTQAFVKLNDKLAPLPSSGTRAWASGGVAVTIRPLDDDRATGGQFPAEFVLRLPGAAHELGFRGFARC